MKAKTKTLFFLFLAACMAMTLPVFGADEKAESLAETPAGKTGGIDYLVLVNKLHPLPDGWEEMLDTVTSTNSLGDEVVAEKNTYNAYLQLKEDLEKNSGIYLELDNGFRSVESQQKIMDDFTATYGADYAAKIVAPPGCSEHHTGLALDLYFRIKETDGTYTDVYLNEDMTKDEYLGLWESVHAKLADYGFILRCLEGREHITGFAYEPWHIRYVGDPDVAKEITAEDITLEEYLGNYRAPAVVIDEGTSEMYSPEELKEAEIQIKCRFASREGCELHSLRYAGDAACNEENIARLNALCDGADAAEIAEFLCDFRTGASTSDALEPNTEYKNYEWWLAKTEDNGWDIITENPA